MTVEARKHSFSRSIFLAFSGVLESFKGEKNIKIHLLATLLVVILGVAVKLSRTEWLFLILTIFVILSAEIFNSAIEEICNLLRDKLRLGYVETKTIRDISAGAVLLLAMASIIIGLFIFIPYFIY